MSARDIFISYRRDGGSHLAELISRELRLRGYSVFMDVHELRSGHFDDELRRQVVNCRDFVFLITKGSIERCISVGDDWVRAELALAIANRVNIVPVMDYGVSMPDKGSLPADIAELPRHNGLTYDHKMSDASLLNLIKRLRSNPKWYRRKETFWAFILALASLPFLAIGLGFLVLWNASTVSIPKPPIISIPDFPKPPVFDMSGIKKDLDNMINKSKRSLDVPRSKENDK